MTMLAAQEPGALRHWVAGFDALSALLGMFGTYFMAKRYANNFVSGLLFAILGMYLYLRRKGAQVRIFYAMGELGKKDVKDSAGDVAFGLNLLFVAFLVQLVKIFISYYFGKG